MAANAGSIELPKLDIVESIFVLFGETPLITHKWSEKAKKEMLDKQMKKASPGKAAKDPEADFESAIYRLPNGGYGFPVIGFKNAAVTACTSIAGISKVAARQAFRVGGTMDGDELVQIFGSEPIPREDMVRVGMGTADIRYRPEFKIWWTKIKVKYNANVMSAEQIANLFNTAGFGVGVGEWRMEKDGQYGSFRMATNEDLEFIEKWEKEHNVDGVSVSERISEAGTGRAARRRIPVPA
jgi:hypothetical protein